MLTNNRAKRAKLNIIFSLVGQLITLVCGLIVPRLLIKNYGSEAYGATASIAQFLAYITLLEGGIGGVARAALYKPIANNDNKSITAIINEIKILFRTIGFVFLLYVLVLAASYKFLSGIECYDWFSTFLLVVVISISTFAQYFIGISYQVLIQASQRTYITQMLSSITTILNTILVVLLVFVNCNLIIVKLVSSFVFAIKPVVQYLYVKRTFCLEKNIERDKNALSQKWTGLGQHIAFFIHSNTDIAVLTIFANLTYVAVYSVYYMIVSQIQNITTSFSTGMEALYGDMIAKKEIKSLHRTFGLYEAIISLVGGVLFSVSAVMIIPFVKLYVVNINDVNYIYPVFGLLMIIASYLYCVRMPYHAMTIAAGRFKQTRFAAYGEAIINISISIVLVIKFNIIGVAIGTVIAVSFRLIFYVIYLSRHIFYRKVTLFIKRFICDLVAFLSIYIIGMYFISFMVIDNYVKWCVASVEITFIAIVFQMIILRLFYNELFNDVINKIMRKKNEYANNGNMK